MDSLRTSGPHAGLSVLAVDDDSSTRQLLCEFLQDFGMDVEVASTGAQMKTMLARRSFDVVLLDLMLPDEPGMDLCSWSKERMPERAVIMLTAADDADSCVEGLSRGADDYVSKPFQARELVARIRAVHRRHADAWPQGPRTATCQHDEPMRRLTVGTDTIVLTNHENRIVGALMDHAGDVVSRERLLELAHAPGIDLSVRSIDTAISSIRSKLGEHRNIIRTVRSEGYVLEARSA
ncbi:response regulator transcription factor [Ramlibacter sp. MMS24-I3-19]|uniref:response regulator transcription factor n=1 Tax=Ramlibacter sp. MMS24-I3-19 TaxID=3416606 RepID=UPI003CFFD01C